MFEMMPLTRAMMSPFYDIDKMTRSFFGESPVRAFRTDIQDNGDSYTLEAELPGFRKEDIAIDIDEPDITCHGIGLDECALRVNIGIDLFLVLEDTVSGIGPEVTDRITDLGTIELGNTLDHVAGTMDNTLIVGNTGNTVLVVGSVHADAVGEVLVDGIVPVERELDTGVADVTTIDIRGIGTEMSHDRSIDEPVLGVFLVPVERNIKFASEHAGIETEVKLLGSLPGDVGVGQLVSISSGTGIGGGRTGVE